MATTWADMANISNLLKVVWAPALTDEINKSNILLDRLQREAGKLDSGGNYYQMTNISAWTQGVGARRERYPEGTVTQSYADTLPAPGYTRTYTPVVRRAYNYGRIRVTGPTMAATRGNEFAVADALRLEMDSLKNAYANYLGTMLHSAVGTGSKTYRTASNPACLDGFGGFLAASSTAATLSGTTPAQITFLDPPGTMYLQPGMLLEAWNLESPTYARAVGSGAQTTVYITVNSVDSATTATVVADSAAGVVLGNGTTFGFARFNDMFSISASLGTGGVPYANCTSRIWPKGIQSLPNMVSDDLYCQGIDPSANSMWKSVYAGSGITAGIPSGNFGNAAGTQNRALTLDLMANVDMQIAKNGGKTAWILTTYPIQYKYGLMMQSLVRFVNKLTLDGGWEGLDYFGKPIIADPWGYPNLMYWMDPSAFVWLEDNQPGWLDKDGNILRYQVSAGDYGDAVEATWAWYANIAIKSRRGNGVLAQIDETLG